MPLPIDEHIKRHQVLHEALDELAADYMTHNRGKILSQTTVLELMQWSNGQTKNPTRNNEDNHET